jgi:hypothetical protein
MKKLVFSFAVSLLTMGISFAQTTIGLPNDYSKSGLQIGVGPVLSTMEGAGAGLFFKWRHLTWGYTHTFSKYSTPSLNVGVIGLPFGRNLRKKFNPFISFDGRFGVRISGVVDSRVIGNEDLKLVTAGGPGLGFSVGPVVLTGKVDFGCQFLPDDSAHPEWRVGGLFCLYLNFDFKSRK